VKIDRELIYYNIFAFLISFSLERALSFFFLTEHGYSIGEISTIQIILAVSSLLTGLPAGIVSDNIGRAPTLALGAILKLFALLGQFVYVENFYAICLVTIGQGISLSLIGSTLNAAVFEALQSRDRSSEFGSRSAILALFISTAIALAMILAGLVKNKTGWSGIYFASASTAGLAVIPLIYAFKVRPKRLMGAIDHQNKIRITCQSIDIATVRRAVPFSLIHMGVVPLFVYGSAILHETGLSEGISSFSIGAIELFGALLTASTYLYIKIIPTKWIFLLMMLTGTAPLLNWYEGPIVAVISIFIANTAGLFLETAGEQIFNNEILENSGRASTLAAISTMDIIFIAGGSKIFAYTAAMFGKQNGVACLAIFPLIGALIQIKTISNVKKSRSHLVS